MDNRFRDNKNINPRIKANILSQIFFYFTLPMLKKGYKKELQETDIYNVVPYLEAKKLGDKFELAWKIEKTNHQNPSVLRALYSCYGKLYLFMGIIQFFMRLSMSLLLPDAISKVIGYFTPGQTKLVKHDAYYYASIVIGFTILNTIYNHNYAQILIEIGIRIRTACSSLIYRKSLKINTYSTDVTMGQIATIITKDVLFFEGAMPFFNDIWIGLCQAALVTYLMYNRVGIAVFAGIGCLLIIMFFQPIAGRLASKLRVKASKKTDQRLQLTQELLSAIKIIKMYTWETFFHKKIENTRQKEMNDIRKIYYLKVLILTMGTLASNISFFVLIMTYKWLGNDLTAETVYFVMNCFHNLRSVITISIPLGIVQLADVAAALKRIQNVLLVEQLRKPTRLIIPLEKPQINLKNVSIKIVDKYVLKHLNIHIKAPGLSVITGSVGSGKSLLLKTILEDINISQGTVRVSGRVSYASQEPWVFPSTIRQNILFGQKYDKQRYEKVLQMCALLKDINNFEWSDSTLIEDGGLNLSKGQQARINLARAIYKEADIYLLDDCFSSVDSKVQEYIYNKCLLEFLENKIVILASHNEKHLKYAKHVLVLENGMVQFVQNPTIFLKQDIPYIDKEEYRPEKYIEEITEDDDEEKKLIKNKMQSVRNIYTETKESGKVKFEIYKKYLNFAGGSCFATLLIIFFIVAQGANSYSEKLLSEWVNVGDNLTQYKNKNLTNTTEYLNIDKKHTNMVKIYTMAMIFTTVLLLARAVFHFWLGVRASINLHKSMLSSIVNAKINFFDTHFIGNIINRFSKDLGTVDEYIPFVIYECLRLWWFLVGVVVLIVSVNYVFIIPALICFLMLYFIRKLYIPTGRGLKRLDASTRSPVMGYLNATLNGLTTIRAFQNQKILKQEFDRHQDTYTSANYMLTCATRAFAFSLDMLGTFFVAAIILRFTLFSSDSLAGNVGLAITQAFTLTGLLQWAIRQWTELENQMTSVERIVEYIDIEKENKSGINVENWPKDGCIIFKNVCLKYNNSKNILKNLSFQINPCEKIGIVGRTGAGKTSIISALFRLYNIEGEILIDNIDIKSLSLNFLRSNIAVIPQDPILFSGTIRDNIDPYHKYSDEEIWKCLDMVKMKNIIKNLDEEIPETGNNNFSTGQKQLISMARAIICKNKIIILDEATANMDSEYDKFVHNAVQSYFSKCTVITIAHRLNTILKSDRVMVIDNGEVIEFDTPKALIQTEGFFYKMLEQANLLN